jgi:hypothetical protein
MEYSCCRIRPLRDYCNRLFKSFLEQIRVGEEKGDKEKILYKFQRNRVLGKKRRKRKG